MDMHDRPQKRLLSRKTRCSSVVSTSAFRGWPRAALGFRCQGRRAGKLSLEPQARATPRRPEPKQERARRGKSRWLTSLPAAFACLHHRR
jgi:hypothetical protein